MGIQRAEPPKRVILIERLLWHISLAGASLVARCSGEVERADDERGMQRQGFTAATLAQITALEKTRDALRVRAERSRKRPPRRSQR